jgi:hypothetical protein
VLGYCSKQLGLTGIACRAASSRQLRKASLAAARGDAALFLVDTVKAAASAARVDKPAAEPEQQRLQQHLKAVAWLLQVEPTAAKTATTAQLLLHVPGVPLQMTEQLVAAGVRVSFEQICAAASDMVAGVELWVQAHLKLGAMADIPRSAVMVCVRDTPEWVSWHVQQKPYSTAVHRLLCVLGRCKAAGLMLCSAT